MIPVTVNAVFRHPRELPFGLSVIAMPSLPPLQPVDQPLNPTVPRCLGSRLASVRCDRIVKVAHAPQPVNDARCHRWGATDRTVDAAEVVTAAYSVASVALFLCAESAARMTAWTPEISRDR
jgi:hypothetical protein